MDDDILAKRLLDVLQHDVLPVSKKGVDGASKVFGAAILLKSDLSLVLAETNNEAENPLWHGEMHAIKKLYEMPRERIPDPGDCIFLASHEPCSLCLSAITWAGFDNFYYFFSYEDTRDTFEIPHDLRILSEVFRLDNGEYAHENHYWSAHHIRDIIAALPETRRHELEDQSELIAREYDGLSATYQDSKGGVNIPLP